MFQKKLADAQSHQAQKRKRVVGYAALAVFALLFFALLAYLITQFDFVRVAPQAIEEPLGQSTDGDSGDRTPQPPPDIEEPTGEVFPDAGAQVSREQFMAQLAQYESEIEPKIAEIRLHDWDERQYAELEDLKARALENFSNGEYLLAREALQQARVRVEEAAAMYASRLAALKREAKEAFANERAPEAEKAVQQVLRLNPGDAEMLALQKRVGVLPQVLDWLQRADAARKENRLEKEITALQKVLSLDSARGGVQTRLQTLQSERKQQRFSAAVRAANNALDSGDLERAATQIALAKTLFPSAAEIAPLQKRLQQARMEREFEKQTALGEQAGQRDDWPAAATHFERARRLKPSDKAAVENHDSARQVVDTAQQIDSMLAREHRLGDKAVLNSVSAYLREVEPVAGRSPGLRQAHRELARKVALYQTEVEVIVVSDNATRIIVRGHGQVGETGKTVRRTIRLRPGKRVFEGFRAGYKSKLVTVDLVPGAPPLEVTVICDEKI